MILQLRLSCRLVIPRKLILSKNATNFLNSKLFSTTAFVSMPRKARLSTLTAADEEEKEIIVDSKWSNYAPRRRNTFDEVRSVTSFGSLRVDADNVPQLELNRVEETKERSSLGGSYTESYSKINAHKSDYLSLLIEEQSNTNFPSITPLVPEKLPTQDEEESIAKQHFSFGKFRENKTIPVSFENPKTSEKGDFNYFDEMMFQESYQKFSTEEANKIREVKVDGSVQVAREQSLDSELNLIDQDYFSPNFGKPMDVIEGQSDFSAFPVTTENIKLNKDDNLNYIDEQFFNPQLKASSNLHTNLEAEKNENFVPSTSWFESDISAFEPVIDVVEDKADTDDELKARMKAKRAEKLSEKVSKQQEIENVAESDVKKPVKKTRTKTSTEGSALDYVRRLRKSQDSPTSATHPHDLLGHHLQDRFLAATSNLQHSVADRRLSVVDEEVIEHVGVYVDVKKYKPPDLETYTRNEVKELLLSKILYNDHDIVAVWKPYGIPMFLTDKTSKTITQKTTKPKHRFSIQCFLPELAKRVDAKNLYEVHRLDSTTTGVVLYAKTKEMELKLRKLFYEKKVQKSYICLCNGVPQADSGVIDIPVGEGSVGGRTRMTLRPDYNASKIISNKKSTTANIFQAVTEYRVLSSQNNASLVETKMLSGKKHQIRLHLGLGLGCPILGDHKFSYPDQFGKPQRVKGDILHRLHIRKSKSRDLPIFLHARKISIPDIVPDGNLVISANLPHFFTKTMKKLKLRANRNDN